MAMIFSCVRSVGRGARAVGAVLVVAATAAGAIPALAQAVYGSVAGTVRDASGAAVPGGTVTITSHERGSAVTITTNAPGRLRQGPDPARPRRGPVM